MKSINRRSFLKTSALAAGAGLLARGVRPSAWAQPAGANGDVRLAIIGLNGKGTAHLKHLLTESGVRVAALCDVDPTVLARAVAIAKEKHVEPFTSNDARTVFARDDVDAVLIATGNYWHALLTIWACQAGKDVYVEKPMAHTIWEGRKMIEAAAKYRRVVQVGMQYSSEPGLIEAGEYLRAGKLGKIQHLRAIYYSKRDSIGRRFAWYPGALNYDAYCGPAPVVPLERDQLHYDWHWMWATGNGDIGNNGVHLLGVAQRMVGHTAPPPRVLSLGGRFVIDDVAQTPNTMITVYDYPDVPVIYEQRNLSAKPGVNYMDQCHGLRVGVVVQCEGGVVAGLVGATASDRDGKVIKKFEGTGGGIEHMRNFLAAVTSRRAADLAAPTEFGHGVAANCHYGNISYRLGAAASVARVEEVLEGAPAARGIFDEVRKHLDVHSIDFARHPLTLGQWIRTDFPADGIAGVEPGAEVDLAKARYLLRETQRPPYAVPDQV